jgi:16S rRNA (cytosine1402-N4)-methyltransferase
VSESKRSSDAPVLPARAPSNAFKHLTVMRDEVVRALSPKDDGVYVDATLGGGGHTEALLEASAGARVVGLDRDQVAIEAAKARLAPFGERFEAVHARFGDAGAVVPPIAARAGKPGVDGLVADLGVSSPQLDDSSRGMSFRKEASDAPLDMRMDRSQGRTVRELIEELEEEALANVIFDFGEERRSRKIARSIKRAETEGQLATTGDLRHAIYRAVGGDKEHGIDPATRTFQALRIAVNDELGELDRLLEALPTLLAGDGVAAIISFHSLEDGRVKRAFSDEAVWDVTSKKPIVATEAETAENPRARSAKLRVARRRREGEVRDESTEKKAKYEARKARRFATTAPVCSDTAPAAKGESRDREGAVTGAHSAASHSRRHGTGAGT